MTNAIFIENLTKTYGKHRGVSDLSLTVPEGEIFGFLGPNGAGKSTTIRSILGLIHFQEGEITVLGKDAVKDKTEILKQIGYMPSESQFYPQMKVRDVIKFAADIHGKDCASEANRLCDRLEVDREKKIDELSLGNRKKVSIVCAMQHKPTLFIFDEPTSGLDPLMQAAFFELVTEAVKNGASCFLSSHVLGEIKKYCHRAAIIKEGRLICVDTVENLTKTHAKRVHVVKDGVEESFTFKGQLNDLFASFAGQNISDITITEPDLEEVFMHYYEGEERQE